MSEDNRGLALAGALNGLFPHLPRYLRPKVIPRTYDQFFGQLVREAFRLRRAKHQERNDFINHLLDMQREHQLSEEQLTSHAMTFMFDGLDTTSSTISHCLLLVSTAVEEGTWMKFFNCSYGLFWFICYIFYILQHKYTRTFSLARSLSALPAATARGTGQGLLQGSALARFWCAQRTALFECLLKW